MTLPEATASGLAYCPHGEWMEIGSYMALCPAVSYGCHPLDNKKYINTKHLKAVSSDTSIAAHKAATG